MITHEAIGAEFLSHLRVNPFRLTPAQAAANVAAYERAECKWCIDNGCPECESEESS